MLTVCNIPVNPPNAPSLIQDLLVAHGDALSVRAICRTGALINVQESAIRVALNRLAANGKISISCRGWYVMNSSAISRAVDTWQHNKKQLPVWSGNWLAVHDAGVLKSDKTVWRHHNLALALSGFRLFQPGLHLRPDNLPGGVHAMRLQLQELGLAPQAAVFQLKQLDADRQAQALTLWNTISSEYEQIRAALKQSSRHFRHGKLEDCVRESLLLGRAVISRLVRDPLLPDELASISLHVELTKETKTYQQQARKLWQTWLSTEPDTDKD